MIWSWVSPRRAIHCQHRMRELTNNTDILAVANGPHDAIEGDIQVFPNYSADTQIHKAINNATQWKWYAQGPLGTENVMQESSVEPGFLYPQ